MDLPVASAKLKAHLPPASALPPGCGFSPTDDAQSIPCLAAGKLVPHGPFPEADLWGLFRGVLLQLWLLWELLLIGEPLLLIAPTPAQCSEAAAALVNLIAPLPYSVDFRPYFTIHDPDFPPLTQPGAAPKPHLLGVTNLFFLKAMRTLPHVISVGTPPPTRAQLAAGPAPETGPAAARASPSRLRNMSTGLSPFRRLLGSGGNLLRAARQRAQGPISLMAEHKECVWTNYVPTTKPDTVILNRLVSTTRSSLLKVVVAMLRLLTSWVYTFHTDLASDGPPCYRLYHIFSSGTPHAAEVYGILSTGQLKALRSQFPTRNLCKWMIGTSRNTSYRLLERKKWCTQSSSLRTWHCQLESALRDHGIGRCALTQSLKTASQSARSTVVSEPSPRLAVCRWTRAQAARARRSRWRW